MNEHKLENEYIYYKMAEATEHIFNKWSKGETENSVIFFDIDDTLIYNFSDNIIIPVYNFYNWIKGLGIIPVIITARLAIPDSVNFTINQLKRLNITDYKYIFFRETFVDVDKIEEYKKSSRKVVQDLGYNILMSVGDMYWDIGDHGGIGILMRKNMNK